MILLIGAFAFGLVIGWVTYRTIRRSSSTGLSDLATVIGAVGGGAVTALFPAGGMTFGTYAIGLAVGFFAYFITAVVLAAKLGNLGSVNEWLGERSAPRAPSDGHRTTSVQDTGLSPAGAPE
ncbi:MAG TPA: hypothetical protein VF832_04180 [Longimicrobiales bacterium]